MVRPTKGVPPLDDHQRRELTHRIAAERSRLVAQAATMRQTFDELVAAADLEPPDDEHDPDGTTAYERAQVTSLQRASTRGIAVLDEASRRLASGAYGTCSSCGQAIPFDRLMAVLGTDRCIACATGRG